MKRVPLFTIALYLGILVLYLKVFAPFNRQGSL